MENYTERFAALLKEGEGVMSILPDQYWVHEHQISVFQKWISSSINLLQILAPADSHFARESARIQGNDDFKTGVATHLVRQTYGLLQAAAEEWKFGFLTKVEYVISAATFDDFLDHAETYFKGGMKNEAAVLAGAVLEDSVKKIAKKNEVPHAGLTLDPLIDALVKKGTFTPVKAKRLKAYAGVRNAALHAEWDKFDLKDVGEAIAGTHELIAEHL